MQVRVHHWCIHKYKTNASYGCTIDVLISIKKMQVMGAPLMCSQVLNKCKLGVHHWCPHKYKPNASYGCIIDVFISINQMQVMGAPLMYS